MKRYQSSTTAQGMALVRAVEWSKPEAVRICSDPLARSLVSDFSYRMSKLMIDSGLYGRMSKGVLEFITARDRYIDDFLKAGLAEGLDQVVLLGAGFDTRPYRIPGIGQTRVFEVDHPATQQVKQQRLKRAVNPLPGHVTFVPVDFNTQTLAERLPASGYNEGGKTLFIWQGVTMYLSPEAVDRTLAFIAGRSAPGSLLIFDYFTDELLHSAYIQRVQRLMRMIGEALTFGIDQRLIGQFLGQRGFCDIHSADADELTRRYFTGANAGRAVRKGAEIASARVATPAS
ncbi:MAG TPA: SAM-dependent methyltransferase [Roseiflexaceae bacterium]|nr:SAM-dependent methyltransferase [Roseiflexaceae bacterium]